MRTRATEDGDILKGKKKSGGKKSDVLGKEELVECLSYIDSAMGGLSKMESADQSDCVIFQNGVAMAGSSTAGIYCRYDFDFGLEGAVILEPLLDMVRKAPEGEIMTSIEDGALVIKAGRFSTGIKHDANITLQYPLRPKKWNALPVDFKSALEVAVMSVAYDNMENPKLNNVHIKDDVVESTNNKKMSRFQLSESLDDEFMIGSQFLSKIIALAPQEYGISGNMIFFKNDKFEIAISKGAIEFVDLERFFKVKGDSVEFPAETKNILERIMAITKDMIEVQRSVTITFKGDTAEFRAKGNRGWVVETADLDKKVKSEFSVMINPEYLNSIIGITLSAVICDKMVIFQSDNLKHIIAKMLSHK